MTKEEAIEILKAYRSKLSNSVSNQLDGDIKAFDIAINSLEIDERYELEYEQIEPCEDAISRQAYIERYRIWGYSEFGRKMDNEALAIRVAMSLPPVTPQPKTGHWINIDATHSQCDRCGAVFEIVSANGEANYCPNCRAKMQIESEGE